jgi:hypothetical protein
VHRFGCKRFAGYPIYVELNYQKRDERVTGRFKHTKNRACGTPFPTIFGFAFSSSACFCPVMQNEGKPVHLCNCPHLRKGDIIWTGSKFAEAVNVPEREAPITGHLSCGCPIMTFKGVQLHMDGCAHLNKSEREKIFAYHQHEARQYINRAGTREYIEELDKPRTATEVTMLESFKIQRETLQSQLRLCAACERESTKLRRMHGDCGRVTAYGYSLGEKDQVLSPYYRREDCWKFPSKWCEKCLDPDSDNGNLRYPCGKAMSPMVMPDVGGAPDVCFRTGPKGEK